MVYYWFFSIIFWERARARMQCLSLLLLKRDGNDGRDAVQGELYLLNLKIKTCGKWIWKYLFFFQEKIREQLWSGSLIRTRLLFYYILHRLQLSEEDISIKKNKKENGGNISAALQNGRRRNNNKRHMMKWHCSSLTAASKPIICLFTIEWGKKETMTSPQQHKLFRFLPLKSFRDNNKKNIKIDIVSRVNISQSLVLVNFETGQRGEREREKRRLLVECKSY